MHNLDEPDLTRPFKGSRRLSDDLWDNYDLLVNRKGVQRLMRLMGIRALHPGATTTPLIHSTRFTRIWYENWRSIGSIRSGVRICPIS